MIRISKIFEPEMDEPSWILYEEGHFNKPIALLNPYEAQKIAETIIAIPYHKLLNAVESKYANETRYETALRYIQETEKGNNSKAKQA